MSLGAGYDLQVANVTRLMVAPREVEAGPSSPDSKVEASVFCALTPNDHGLGSGRVTFIADVLFSDEYWLAGATAQLVLRPHQERDTAIGDEEWRQHCADAFGELATFHLWTLIAPALSSVLAHIPYSSIEIPFDPPHFDAAPLG